MPLKKPSMKSSRKSSCGGLDILEGKEIFMSDHEERRLAGCQRHCGVGILTGGMPSNHRQRSR